VAKANADGFMDSALGHLWPNAVDTATGELERSLVASEYLRINVDPSERYVLSVPGSIVRRLPPDCSTFSNLYLAGDWLMGRVNSGSVEAAMASGVRAADAIRKAAPVSDVQLMDPASLAELRVPRTAALGARTPPAASRSTGRRRSRCRIRH
jgi:hypothetical protein